MSDSGKCSSCKQTQVVMCTSLLTEDEQKLLMIYREMSYVDRDCILRVVEVVAKTPELN